MKLTDIKRILSQKVAELITDGFVLVDDDSSFGNICRYDLWRPGEDTKLRVFLENEHEFSDRYLDMVVFRIYRMPYQNTFIDQKKDPLVFEKRFYQLGRGDWYVEDEDTAIKAKRVEFDRYMLQRISTYRKDLGAPSANLLKLLKKYKGFGKCNESNTRVFIEGKDFTVVTIFAGREHKKYYRVGR